MSDVIGEIERLVKLRDAGALSPQEFEAQKARLLAPQASSTCSGCGAPLQLDPSGRCIYCGLFSATGQAAGTFAAPSSSGNGLAENLVRKYPDKKIQAIKEYREATGAGLKEAKAAMDTAYARGGR